MLAAAACAALVTGGCGRADPVRDGHWLAARVTHGGRIVRLATAGSSGVKPVAVHVRTADDQVGLTVRERISDAHSEDVRVRCVEVELLEPVGGRRLVDDGPGARNPFHVSTVAARRLVAKPGAGCPRVPALFG